jgi:hypothetical protein
MVNPEIDPSPDLESSMKATGVENAAVQPQGFWRQHGWWIAVLALVLLGRVWGIANYSLDWDECNELAMAKLPLQELIRIIYSRDIHPPAAHILTHFWVGLVGDSDLKVRLLYVAYGLLGLWGTYLLARLAHAPKKVAIYTLLLGIACPFVWHYTHLATHHAFYYAVAVFSWVFFLRMLKLERLSWRSADCWGYVLVTLLCLYAQSIAPFLLLSQAVLLFWKYPQKFMRQPVAWLGIAVVFVVCYLPQLWAISQPWHSSKIKEMGDEMHGRPSWGSLLFMPAQLFWMGDDQAFQPLIPKPERLLFYGGLGSFLLWYGFRSLRRVLPGAGALSICIIWIPVGLLFLVSITLGLHVLHGRAILYATFPVLLAMACWIWEIERKRGLRLAMALLAGIILVQAWVDVTFIELPTNKDGADFKRMVQSIQPLRQPGDGFLISPGYMSLGIMRYLKPAEFGLTYNELHMDPRKENLFHMVQRIEGPYFFVSGQDVRQRPEIQQAFRDFEKTHPRIWYMGDLRDYNDQLDCKNTFLVKGPDQRYWQVHCSFLSPKHCRAPLTGPDANHWQCNSDIQRQQQSTQAAR